MSLRARLSWPLAALFLFAGCQVPAVAVALDDFHAASNRDGTEVDVLDNDHVTGSDPIIEVTSGPSCGELIESTSSVVVAGTQECDGIITLTYRVVDEYGASGEAIVEISLPDASAGTTTTTGQQNGVLAPDRRLVDFGEVENQTTGRETVIFENIGLVPVEVVDVVTTPDTDFDAEATECERVIDVGGQCSVAVIFTPAQELPDDPGQRATPFEHQSSLQLLDDQGGILAEVELAGTSVFLLTDLSIDVVDFGLPGRIEGGVGVSVALRMENSGRSDAGQFLITAEYQDVETEAWLPGLIAPDVPAQGLRVQPLVNALPIPGLPSGSGEDITLRVGLPGQFDPVTSLPVRVIIDACVGEVPAPDCQVVEYDESNNISADVDVNPVFGHSEVDFDGGLSSVGTGETNFANLVTDALFWAAGLRAEELGLAGPGVALLSSETMLTGLVLSGDLRPLQLIDVWDSEIVITDPLETAVLDRSLELGVASGDSRIFRFPHAGNGTYQWCSSGAEDGTRVFDLEVGGTQVVQGGQVIVEEAYPIATVDPLMVGGPYQLNGFGYTGVGVTLRGAVVEYIQSVLQGTVTTEHNEGAYQPGGNGRIEAFGCGVD